MKKIIEVRKHPYMWKVEVTFGTLQEMLDKSLNVMSSSEIEIGGSFNISMDSTKRAALICLGCKISPSPDRYRFPNVEDIKEVKGICSSPWEGVYWYVDYFDEFIGKGLYPINADWDGKTYIERGYYDKNHRWVEYYELTDTYRY